MNVAVLGSGNGGCAVAFDCATHGHDVRLFDFHEFPENIRAVQESGGIESTGELNGFASVVSAGHDIEETLHDANVIYLVGPAYSTRPFAEACAPHLSKGQIVVVCPSSCGGAFEFKSALGHDLRDDEIIVSETSTLPYAVRILEPGKIRVFLKVKKGLFLAALPSRRTAGVLDAIQDVYPTMEGAKNVIQTTLQNGNPVIHPSVTLLNAALIERTGGDFFFYEDGVTPAVGRLMKAVDDERIAIGKALGVEVISDPELGFDQGYMKEPSYDVGYSQAPGFKGIRAQTQLDYRYFHEDVGYGLVFLRSLGEQVGVATPVIDAVIRVVSAVMERDYLAEGKRTMQSLKLSGFTADQLDTLVS